MRRNQAYFAGKLKLMFRMNVLDGLREQLFQDKDEDETRRKPKMYHHNDMDLNELRTKFISGDIMSCFTMSTRSATKLYVACERQR